MIYTFLVFCSTMEKTCPARGEESPSKPSQLYWVFLWENSSPLYPSQRRKRMLWLSTTELAHALIISPRPIALAGWGKCLYGVLAKTTFCFLCVNGLPRCVRKCMKGWRIGSWGGGGGGVTFLPEATTFLQINASWGNLPVQKQQGRHLTGFVIFL